MKGFKKDGKFRPTEKRSKSAISKSDMPKREVYHIKKYIPIEERKKEELDPEEVREEIADKLDEKFSEIIKVDTGYSRVYGSKNQYYKTGVEDGLSGDDIEMIKEELGYDVYGMYPANNYFVDVVFKKIGDRS